MSHAPSRSPWPRRLLVGLAALLLLDTVVLVTAASIPAVRNQMRRLVPLTRVAHLAPTGPRMFAQVCSDDSQAYTLAYGDSDKRGFRYLHAQPSHDGDKGWEMSGHFNHHRMSAWRQERTPFVWFGDYDDEYLVRDSELVAKAQRITIEVRQLGMEMGRIGAQQGRIGARQGRIGAQQGALGARLGALAVRRASAALAGDQPRAARLESEIEDVQRRLERQSRELEAQMRPLASEQERLGRVQAELGRKQQGLVEIETRRMRDLFEQAKREGKAVRLHSEA